MSDVSVPAPGTTAGSPHTVTAFFDSRSAADTARTDLIAAGLSPDTITVAEGPADHGGTAPVDEGFWHALKEFFMPDEDRFAYAEGLRRGGVALSVRTGPEHYERAIDILDADGAVDIDEREQAWRSEGWQGYRGTAEPGMDDMGFAPVGAGTAGFGASLAGEDGYAHPGVTVGTDEAESRGDTTRVGTGAGEPGLLNPDMRERIGSGTASMTPSTPTGSQDATLGNNAANHDRGSSAYDQARNAEDATLGSATRSGVEVPSIGSVIGSAGSAASRGNDAAQPYRRDETLQRPRVRGYVVDPSDNTQSGL